MKVYVVSSIDMETNDIKGIFSTQELAEQRKGILELENYKRWEQWLTDEEHIPTKDEIEGYLDFFVINEYEVDQ